MAEITQTYQLNDLTDFIRRVFALNLPSAVWIAAEIGQANESRGNTWLTLVQKEPDGEGIIGQLDGVVWQRSLAKLRRTYGVKMIRSLFQDGMSVRLKVTTSFHQRYGLRLVVEDIDPSHTLGALEQRRQETLAALAAEGLLKKNSGRTLSTTPLKLAVISSDTAAGLADFRDQLGQNPYGYEFSLRLFPAAMQGAQTGPEVIARLKQILKWGETYDAVVIVRGGGGRTDLAAFDNEALARTVADYTLPIISGIGHETDDAVLDRVAHTSLKTPTAVAVFLIERVAHSEAKLLTLSRDLQRHAAAHLYQSQRYVDRIPAAITSAATAAINYEVNRLDRTAREVKSLPARHLREAAERITGYEKLLTALRPETTLARGYALVSQDGQLLTAPDQLRSGNVQIRLKGGEITLRQAK
ncbi:exodeoxyribonuclease VII large subunit [Neolewinella antarctica]|uniref:Exodeoxyribonuclease 7 large subunit n=1 Tax=Neolewinella antarctica TaxID=442734 RepID=A0ABX0X6D6_9BACT|nr:exodeoxyribonuclease VII large subunit [Neolewinella antarctica]NJC24761.1 exodeoxyribonuclease VII large subunit [Neolewinella antarctica]